MEIMVNKLHLLRQFTVQIHDWLAFFAGNPYHPGEFFRYDKGLSSVETWRFAVETSQPPAWEPNHFVLNTRSISP